MAFAFFRRRQKMVIIIMVVLMISFLIGYQGFQMLTRKSPSDIVLGTTSVGKITRADYQQAQTDTVLLRQYVGLGIPSRMAGPAIWPTDMEFYQLLTGEQSDLAYALLLAEAEKSSVQVTEGDLDNFFARTGRPVGSESYRAMLANLKASQQLAEKHLRATVGRWLKIYKYYQATTVQTPPSEGEVQRLYRDLFEQIDLRVVTIPAETFLETIPLPIIEEIADQFDRYKAVEPGRFRHEASFGFGYRQSNRVRIAYLLLRDEPIRRVTQPSDKMVRDYYLRHREEFVEELAPATAPADPSSTPPTQPTTDVTSQPMPFSQAKERIVEQLKDTAVRQKIDDLLGQINTYLETYQDTQRPPAEAYEWIVSQMRRPAEEILQRTVTVEIHQQPLDQALDILAEVAALQAIYFPREGSDDSRLDASVRVSLSAREIPLAEALRRLSQQLKWPEVDWALCEGFDAVLFPVDDFDQFPLSVGQTGLVDQSELWNLDLLNRCATPTGKPLAMLAFQAKAFATTPGAASVVQVGEEGPSMIVYSDVAGRLLWRLTEAVPAHTPTVITDAIRKQIIQDIRITKAFRRANEQARQLAESARQVGLVAAAKDADLPTTTTGLFSRITLTNPQRDLITLGQMRGLSDEEVLARALLAKPIDFTPTQVPELSIPVPGLQEYFLKTAFSLSPEQIEPQEGPVPYPEEPFAVAYAELPARKEVVVLQRADFRPAVIDTYQTEGRQGVLQALSMQRAWQMRQNWFTLSQIVQRLNFQPER